MPLWTKTADALRKWIRERDWRTAALLFTNYRGERLTRNGIDYVWKKAVTCAMHDCPGLATKRVTPHVIRHAMQAGIDIRVIALWLGHESVDTTHIYMEADLTHKEEAPSRL
ncbi:tyrosine-type recombinase/integrase [Paraburkholderia sp. BCC1885]|uniref:tyrosine-type recombinase/integrase n=1 Tax=Paraburkholderia sp. BCC1885 TaxID=2562669 RepID=UPI0016434274|nr:tyrosine-type recombinase/integrase [Paraburkholderia sp. BCC1885]